MKNIQIIDGAMNSTFEIYSIPDDLFRILFPNGADIAFAEDFDDDLPGLDKLYLHRVRKPLVQGIHGTLHLKLSNADRECFPSRHESDVIK